MWPPAGSRLRQFADERFRENIYRTGRWIQSGKFGVARAPRINKRKPDELPTVIEPIESLIRKSRKAQAKLKPGTWQHAMLHGNLQALELAFALMSGRTEGADVPARKDFEAALRAFDEMTTKSAKAQTKFLPGTSRHTLLRNRLEAFRAAKGLIKTKLK